MSVSSDRTLINNHLYYRAADHTYSRVVAWIRCQGTVMSGRWCEVRSSDRLMVLLQVLGVMYHRDGGQLYFTLPDGVTVDGVVRDEGSVFCGHF